MSQQTFYNTTDGTLILNTPSFTSNLIIKPPENKGALKLSASSRITDISVETSKSSTYKLNSVWISDLNIEVADTIQLPYGEEAYVRNIGTSKHARLIFGIPQGEKGDTGEVGNGIAYIELYNIEGLNKTYRVHYTNGNIWDYIVKDGKTPEWGEITGNILNQVDLKNALDAKANETEVVKSVQQKTPIDGNVDILPDVTGQRGKVLSTDGTNLEWIANQSTTYEYNQGVASDTWVITHNLNKHPSVTVVDSAENVVKGSIYYNSDNQLTITFNGGFKGKAYLN